MKGQKTSSCLPNEKDPLAFLPSTVVRLPALTVKELFNGRPEKAQQPSQWRNSSPLSAADSADARFFVSLFGGLTYFGLSFYSALLPFPISFPSSLPDLRFRLSLLTRFYPLSTFRWSQQIAMGTAGSKPFCVELYGCKMFACNSRKPGNRRLDWLRGQHLVS